MYTAILAGRDQLMDPTVVTPGCRYVCFTDAPLVSEVWEIVRVPVTSEPRKAARRYKIMAHRLFETEYSLWVDGAFWINVDVRELVARYMTNASVATFAHWERDCVYEHAEQFIAAGVGATDLIRAQMSRYRAAGLPDNAGLWNTGALLRRHAKETTALNESWWHELEVGSLRDELSFCYCVWRQNVPVAAIEGHTLQSAELQLMDHRQRRRRSEFEQTEWERLVPPRAVTSVPDDLKNVALEYDGIYLDGWLDDTVFVGIWQPDGPVSLALCVTVPLIDDPGFATEIEMLVDGQEVARETVGIGDVELRVPMPPGAGRRRVQLHFSNGQPLPEQFPRRVGALMRFIGFDVDTNASSPSTLVQDGALLPSEACPIQASDASPTSVGASVGAWPQQIALSPAEPRIVVYTTILGGRDQLKDPTVFTPNCRYVCFTDQPLQSEAWEIVRVQSGDDRRKASRYYKLMPHLLFESDYSLWVDGTFRICVDVRRLIARHLTRASIAAFAQFERDCTYEHAEHFISFGIGDPVAIRRQMERYRLEGFPEHAGLWNGGVLLRRHDEQARSLNEAWWHELELGSIRDELSLSYCTWKLGIPIATIGGHTMRNAELQMCDHRLQRQRSEFDDAEWCRLVPPHAVSNFPADLDDTALEYAGIYADGWLDDSAFVRLKQPEGPGVLVIRGMVPLVADPAFSTELLVLVDGREIERRTLGPGDFDLKLPMAPCAASRQLRCHFSAGQVLRERVPRRVTALIRFLGFEADADIAGAVNSPRHDSKSAETPVGHASRERRTPPT